MKTLFGETEKSEVDRSKIINYMQDFLSIGYQLELLSQMPFDSKADVIALKKVGTAGKKILIFPWLRPESLTRTQTIYVLDDYPRLSIPKNVQIMREEDKVKETIKMMSEHDIYFMVILPIKHTKPMYWLGRYDEIPLKCWKLNWWGKKGVSTRLLLRDFHKYEFGFLPELKIKLDKIFDK